LSEILLELQASVGCEEDFETRRHSSLEKFPVLRTRPALLPDSADIMPSQFVSKRARQLFIEQHAH
jgi:hypothetical protein